MSKIKGLFSMHPTAIEKAKEWRESISIAAT